MIKSDTFKEKIACKIWLFDKLIEIISVYTRLSKINLKKKMLWFFMYYILKNEKLWQNDNISEVLI